MWMLIIVLLASNAVACGDGCEEHQGVCACDAPMEKAVQTDFPSDEKPRKSQQPEWQTGEVVAAMPPSEAAHDAKLDQERADADAEGKRAAGL